MGKRGRPPHPDVLTPREWEVLALLRDGLSNEEIAERLGITLRTARYHVSEILTKLGLRTRKEAALWDRSRRPWWASALAPMATLARKAGSAAPVGLSTTAMTVSAAAVAGVLVTMSLIGFGLLRGSTAEGSVAMTMQGMSMMPTVPKDAQLAVEPYGDERVARLDIVAFRDPDSWPAEPDRIFIKRIVALAGETVEVRDGRVFVNGTPLEEPYILEPPMYTIEPQVVPTGDYYVLGDNRNNSSDSHLWGTVPLANIIGRVTHVNGEPVASP